jgi:DNA invertase Pin-like site-specific DNA recombinase
MFAPQSNDVMKAKYNRISSNGQSLSRQEINSQEFDLSYSDTVSGTVPFFERKEAGKLVKDIRNGKVRELHVTALDRMARNILDLLTVIEFLNSSKVNLYVENIGIYSMINSEPNPTFKMIASVLGNVAEMERTSMLERQRSGIEAAKAKGVYKGRLHGTPITDEAFLSKYKKVAKELNNGSSLRRAALLGECSLGTVQKVQRLLQKQKMTQN